MLCHKSIRKVAKDMASAAYEELAKENEFYEKWPAPGPFVAKYWNMYVPAARHTLLNMLNGNYPEQMKEEIFDIIMKDRTLQDVKSMPAQGNA